MASVSPLFFDESQAVVANVGSPQSGTTVSMGLTDPDSSEIVPPDGPRFAGDFMLTTVRRQSLQPSRDPADPANYLGALNPWTGRVSALAVGGVALVAQGGLLYWPREDPVGR